MNPGTWPAEMGNAQSVTWSKEEVMMNNTQMVPWTRLTQLLDDALFTGSSAGQEWTGTHANIVELVE